jgi:hypothetical protein
MLDDHGVNSMPYHNTILLMLKTKEPRKVYEEIVRMNGC